MAKSLDTLKGYASSVSKGLILGIAPKIAAGAVNKLFHQWNMDVDKVTFAIKGNHSILQIIDPYQLNQLKGVTSLMDNLDFITPDLIIEGIKKDFPAVASLLINWPEAKDWLSRQVEDLKRELSMTE